MEISPAPTVKVKTPEPDSATHEVPNRTQTNKPLSLTNGVLKRLQPHRPHPVSPPPPPPPPPLVSYKECLKNHAANLGGHAIDGCGEFMPSPTADPANPTSLKCAACGCHRNFHRREPEDPIPSPPPTSAGHHVIEYQPLRRHHPLPPPPPPPRGGHLSPNSASPPPISSSYYPSASQMLLALSSGISGPPDMNNPSPGAGGGSNSGSRKRFRTKFTQDQKDKMLEFADKVGWKMQKRDEEMILEFCNDLGLDKTVFKVWMHNNKSTFGKKDLPGNGNGSLDMALINPTESTTPTPALYHSNNGNHHTTNTNNNNNNNNNADGHVIPPVNVNGSSSSSRCLIIESTAK